MLPSYRTKTATKPSRKSGTVGHGAAANGTRRGLGSPAGASPEALGGLEVARRGSRPRSGSGWRAGGGGGRKTSAAKTRDWAGAGLPGVAAGVGLLLPGRRCPRRRPSPPAGGLAIGRPVGSGPGGPPGAAPGRGAAGVRLHGERQEEGRRRGRRSRDGLAAQLVGSGELLLVLGRQARAAEALRARRQHAAADDRVAAAVDDVLGARADLELAVADDLLRRVGDGPGLLLVEGDLVGDRLAGLAEDLQVLVGGLLGEAEDWWSGAAALAAEPGVRRGGRGVGEAWLRMVDRT